LKDNADIKSAIDIQLRTQLGLLKPEIVPAPPADAAVPPAKPNAAASARR